MDKQNNNTTTERILFITGNLAKPSLEKVLTEMHVDFEYIVHALGLNVAALMTEKLLKRRLSNTYNANRIILPGRFRGNLDVLSEHFGIPVERGPDELKDLPTFFGRAKQKTDLSSYDIQIFAEIVDASTQTPEQILTAAENFRQEGANVIDLGFLPDTPFPHLADSIHILKENNFKVSIDTLSTSDLINAANYGADYLLSLNETTLWVADEVAAIPILIPAQSTQDITSLYRCIDILLEKERCFIADSILDPIHCGFTNSIVRYQKLRHRYPEIKIMMGIGNLTELTHADTIGMNAMLLGIASELHIQYVLTTKVSGHCCKVIKEVDAVRRIMYATRKDKIPPANIDDSLFALHARKPFPYNDEEILYFASKIKDSGYRIQLTKNGIHIYNRDLHRQAIDPFELYPELGVSEDGGHAFYLGVELARAQIAWQLGKRYNQDEELLWGCAVDVKEDDLTRFSEENSTLKK